MQINFLKFIILIFFSFWASVSYGHEQTVDLIIDYKTVNFAKHPHQGLAINNQIPAPTLHFKQGDIVNINVYNHLNKATSLHWHGVLVPWQMDGVEGVTQKGIPPGKVFHYRFKLYQSGTYWYHAHAGLQEQEGLYGAFIIDPPNPPDYSYDKDFALVLSDWSNTQAEKIFANLKKDGDYYSPRFPLQASLLKFLHDYRNANPEQRQMLWMNYHMMQKMRMSIYDIADVAYDAFLLNGHPASDPWIAQVKKGDKVRLRFIGASASTIYRVKIPGAKLQVVQVDGNNIKIVPVDDFTIAPGETYDFIVNITDDKPYIIYAESLDKVGAAYGALISNTPYKYPLNFHVTPFPEPEPMGGMSSDHHEMDHNMASMTSDQNMNHHSQHQTSKYQQFKAAVKTNDPNKTVAQIIHMDLNGWMDSYIWFINGIPEYRAQPIRIEEGKRYRIIFTNHSMMRHPMHIHGHWFILRNGFAEYDPLLHTIEVEPGQTITADIDADASGQWFFHCHHLYHMVAGMARVFQYQTIVEIAQNQLKPDDYIATGRYINRPIIRQDALLPLDQHLIQHPMAHPAGFFLANYFEIGEDPFNNVQMATFKGLYGPDYNKLELLMKDAEIDQGQVQNADLDIFFWHQFSQFWAVKGGINYFNRPAEDPYWQPGIGIEGLMPYFIETDIRSYFYNKSFKIDAELSRSTQITNNFFIGLGIRAIAATQTVDTAEIGSGLNQLRFKVRPFYRLMPGVTIFAEYEYQQDFGVFKSFEANLGDNTYENTITFGVSYLF